MDSRKWHETLRGALRRQNLPRAYIDRLVEELSDHLLDTQTENPSMDAQTAISHLGSTETIAAVANHEFRRQHFAGRHPYFTFVFGPIAFVPLLFFGLLFGPFCIFATLEAVVDTVVALVTGSALVPAPEEPGTLAPYWVVCCYHHFFRFVPFALAAWIFCRWGRRAGMQRWAIVSCGIIAALAGATASYVKPIDGSGEWAFGLALKPGFGQLLQLLVPLAVAVWLLPWIAQSPSTADAAPNPTAT